MTETWDQLGGQPTTIPVVQRGKGNCGRDCTRARFEHADRHCCPWRDTDNGVQDCGCTAQEGE